MCIASPETSEPGLILQTVRKGSSFVETRKYPVKLGERAVRLYRESDPKALGGFGESAGGGRGGRHRGGRVTSGYQLLVAASIVSM